MTPVLIPSPGGDCFGMYGAGSGPVVVLCPPIGGEARTTARIWRDLAVELGRRGMASLRFDLPGTGNSAGDPASPDLIEHWRGAVRACVDWAAERHDGRVVLFGVRFGALLALDVLASRSVEQLVLLDPPVSGSAVARSFRARARLENTSPPEGPGYIQAGELLLSRAALASLATLPAPIGAHDGPGTSLLVLPSGTKSVSPWTGYLATAGCHAETVLFDGYDEFIRFDPFKSAPPETLLQHLADRLASGMRLPAGPAPAPITARSLGFGDFEETPLRFGGLRDLFGIVCCPARVRSDMPAVLLPTTGADPCYGMSRMWTEFARDLARRGIPSLRFDMGGIGESGGRAGPSLLSTMYGSARFDDLRAALDELQSRGSDRVVVVGYCSGAYAAWHAAVTDERIVGVLAGNLLFFTQQPTRSENALLLKPGATQIEAELDRYLPTGMTRTFGRLKSLARQAMPDAVRDVVRTWGSDPAEARRIARALSDRRCDVLIVMAQGDHGHLRLQRAFGETPRFPSGITLKVIEGANHLFSDRRHRARFLKLATDFVLKHRTPQLPASTMRQAISALEVVSC